MSMTSDYSSTRSLSALFDTRAEADRAVAALESAGIADVVLTGGDNQGYGSTTRDVSSDADYRDKGFFEQLGNFFFPDEDRYTYAEGLDRGGFLVTIDNIPADKYEQALDILDDEGAVDLNQREEEWRSEGWSNEPLAGTAAAAGTATGWAEGDQGRPGTVASRAVDSLTGDRQYDEADLNRDGKIDIAEERLFVSKREHDLGRVKIRSYVKETPVEESVNLREEHVTIDRRPVDRAATDADFADRSLEAREYAEEAVVNKEARVVEEIGLRKEATSRDETIRDSVRKTEVEVIDERTGKPLNDGEALVAEKDRV